MKYLIIFLFFPALISAQNIPMKFSGKELMDWKDGKFQTKKDFNEICGFAYMDTLFFIVIGNDLEVFKAEFIDVTLNYQQQYVEQKWYLAEKNMPNHNRMKTVQAIAFTRRHFDSESDDFYWLSLIQYPEMQYGLLFYENPKYVKKEPKKNK